MAPRSSRKQFSPPVVPRLKSRAVFLLHGLLFVALTSLAPAQTIWNTQSGDWFQTANWSDGVPDSATDAQINNGGTPQIEAAGATSNNLTLGLDAGDFGNLIVSGTGSLQLTGILSVGLAGNGSLTIQGGAIVTDDTAAIASFPDTSAGTVMVDGAGSTWSNIGGLSVGGFGTASLMVLNGGAVAASDCSLAGSTHFSGGYGSVLVDGPGSSLSCAQALYINGGLSAQNGGAVVSDSAFVDGSATLDGTGTTWTTGMIDVAPFDFGSLTIRNGAILTSDDFAYISGRPGSVTVDGPGSRWDTDFEPTQLYVGFDSYGALNLTAGGVVSAFAVGVGPYGVGEVTVDGAGSALNVRTALYIGGADFGGGPEPGEIGLVQITEGGAVDVETALLFGQGTIVDDGTLTSTSLDIASGGLLSGNGNVAGDVVNAGQIAPGDPLGTLALVGNLTQYTVGKLHFEISGPNPDAQNHLDITGSAAIDGTVEVRFTDGFLPLQGQVFELIEVSGSVSGSFARVIFPDVGTGFQFSAEFVNGHYQITALNDAAPAAGLLNISTRGEVGADDDVLIAGFIVTGTTEKQVLVRGLGPSLAFRGIPGLLADPTIELRDETGALITSNDNWMDSPQRQDIMDSMLAPGDDREAAILATLAPGSYTAILRGVGNSTGLGIVEAYNLGPDASGSLANISTRGLVSTGEQVLIGGFIVDDLNSIVLLRGLGPSLALAGVSNALANPTLELHDSNGDVIAFNDDWMQSDEALIENTGLAPTFDEESAILTTLGPGAFTAILRGLDETSGAGLFEVYNLR